MSPWNALSPEQKVESIHNEMMSIREDQRRLTDLISRNNEEILFWRKLFAMKEDLKPEQVAQLFNDGRGLVPGAIGRGY